MKSLKNERCDAGGVSKALMSQWRFKIKTYVNIRTGVIFSYRSIYNSTYFINLIMKWNSNRAIYRFFNRMVQSLPPSPATDFGIFGCGKTSRF